MIYFSSEVIKVSNKPFRTGDNDIDNLIWRIEKLERRTEDCRNLPLIKSMGYAEEELAELKKKFLLRKKNLVRLKKEMDEADKTLTKLGCKL